MKEYFPVCPNKCSPEGFDVDKMIVLCYCPEEINLNENSKVLVFKKFKYLNFHVLKCFKFYFKFYLPYIFVIFLVINIILFFVTERNFTSELNNLGFYCSNFINTNHINDPNSKNVL